MYEKTNFSCFDDAKVRRVFGQTVGDGSFLFDSKRAHLSQTKKNRPQLFD